MPKIKFKKVKDKTKKELEVPEGANLREVMETNGIEVYEGLHKKINCGGGGRCGSCRVHVRAGMENLSEMTTIEKWRIRLSWFAIGHEDEVRLSCQTKVNGDCEIEERPAFNWSGDVKKPKVVKAGHFE